MTGAQGAGDRPSARIIAPVRRRIKAGGTTQEGRPQAAFVAIKR